jgi:hypothetical protein
VSGPGLSARATRLWLVALALICALELLTHAGPHNGFLVSSQPKNNGDDSVPGEGYVSWLGDTPILLDAEALLKLSAFMLGERGPEGSGIMDRRAGYAYFASLTVPWLGRLVGPYGAFLGLNLALWWVAAAAMFWFVRQRWKDDVLAMTTSFLIATSHGFLFMAGLPMSYLAAYSALALLLALGEHMGAFTPAAGLRTWLVLGWGAGVASTLYFTHYVLLIGWWLYGLRRIPWLYLVAVTCLTFGISVAWELWGRTVGGLAFLTDNTNVINVAVGGWSSRLSGSWLEDLAQLRDEPARGMLLGAFSYPWWMLAAIGFAAASRSDREWALAIMMGGLIPAILVIGMLPLPRVAFYMYPAMALLAARGALLLGVWGKQGVDRFGVPFKAARVLGGTVTVVALGVLVALTNLDLLGMNWLITNFHYSTEFGW